MNKRELTEHINNTLFDNLKDTFFTEPTFSITKSAKDNKVAITFETEQVGVLVGGMLKKFEKVTIPQFVADWYEENKDDFETNLFNTIGLVIRDFEDGDLSAFEEWILDKHKAPFQTLVNMHQFGYEVEKEKRYYVRFKNMESNDFNYLNFIKFQHAWVLSSIKLDKKFRTEHTRKQLEEAGFGWVFDCPGIEIEEVE